MALEIPISKRARKYGYIFWSKKNDFDVKSYFKNLESATMLFNGDNLGKKTVDWKHRRISVGWSKTRNLSEKENKFEIVLSKNNTLSVKTK